MGLDRVDLSLIEGNECRDTTSRCATLLKRQVKRTKTNIGNRNNYRWDKLTTPPFFYWATRGLALYWVNPPLSSLAPNSPPLSRPSDFFFPFLKHTHSLCLFLPSFTSSIVLFSVQIKSSQQIQDGPEPDLIFLDPNSEGTDCIRCFVVHRLFPLVNVIFEPLRSDPSHSRIRLLVNACRYQWPVADPFPSLIHSTMRHDPLSL